MGLVEFLGVVQVRVLSDPGPTVWEIATAIGTCVAALGVVVALLGARATATQIKQAAAQVKDTQRQVEIGAKQLESAQRQVELAARQVEQLEATRHAAIAVETARRWDGQEIADSRQLIYRLHRAGTLAQSYDQWAQSDADNLFTLLRIPNFFEDLAAMAKFGFVSIPWIDETMGGSVMAYWDIWEPIRTTLKQTEPHAYDNWDTLRQSIAAREATAQNATERLADP